MLDDTWLERSDCRVFVRRRESRSGNWVVLLHGAGADGAMFAPQLPAVPSDWGLCVWDARGHGRSTLEGSFRYADMLDDLTALVDTLGASRLCLVGQSMGGNLAQSFVERSPTVVERLVLIGCVSNHAGLSRSERIQLRLAPSIIAAYPWQLMVRQSARISCLRESGQRYLAETLQRTGRRRFAEVLRFSADALRPDPAYRLPVPTLTLLGDHDTAGRIRQQLTAWPARDPSVEFVMVPDAGHIANLDNGDFVNDQIGRFLTW